MSSGKIRDVYFCHLMKLEKLDYINHEKVSGSEQNIHLENIKLEKKYETRTGL